MDITALPYGFTGLGLPGRRAALPGSMSRWQEERVWPFFRSTAAGKSGKFSRAGWSNSAMSMLRTLALTFAAALSAVVLAAQQSSPVHDTVQAAGPQYGAGGLRQLLLGREYSSLWTTPISVEVLDLRTFAGGLRPVSRGGGEETKALLFQGQDG